MIRRAPIRRLCGIALLATLAHGQTPQDRSQAAIREHVVHILVDPGGGDDPRARAASLVSLGTEAIPVLFDMLARGEMGMDGDRAVRLARPHALVVSEALVRMPGSTLRAFLNEVAAEEYEEQRRTTAIEVLARAGAEKDLVLLGRLAAPSKGPVPRALRIEYAAALERMTALDEPGLEHLRDALKAAHGSLRMPIVDRVAEADDTIGLAVLAGMLGVDRDIDSLILTRMASLGEKLPKPIDEAILGRARVHLYRHEVSVLTSAVHVTEKLGDTAAVPDLIDLLDHPTVAVRGRVEAALRSLTGLRLGRDARAWSEWYRGEMAWWDNEAPVQLELLSSGSPREVVEALRAVSSRVLFTRELSGPLTRVLHRGEPDLVVLACAALGHHRAHSSVPDLVALLDDDDTKVSVAAWRALQEITGQKLRRDSAFWKELAQ